MNNTLTNLDYIVFFIWSICGIAAGLVLLCMKRK